MTGLLPPAFVAAEIQWSATLTTNHSSPKGSTGKVCFPENLRLLRFFLACTVL